MIAALMPFLVIAAEGNTFIPVQCAPDSIAFNSQGLTTWTLNGIYPSGELVDVVLTQDHIDQMSADWWQVEPTAAQVVRISDTESEIRDLGMRSASPASRAIRLVDDHVLSFPIEVIMPGGNLLAQGRKTYPGPYRVTWKLGWGITTTPSILTFVNPSSPTEPVMLPAGPRLSRIPYGMDATFSPVVVRREDDLVATVNRIGAEYDRADVWRSAMVEWTRLPEQPEATTVVFSPLQAGTAAVEARGKDTTPAAPSVRAVRFPVARALQDPRTGKLAPGLYRVRLAMAWDDTVKPIVPNQESVSVRYSIHSLGQVIRLLAPDEQPPSTCAVCGASPVRSATSLAPGLQP